MNKKVAIIGAGLAGCALAYELGKSSNFNIAIFDKGNDIATQASGNFAGILAPYLTSDNNFSDQFHTLGYSLLLDFINQHKDEIEVCNQGVLRILTNEKDLKRYQKIFAKRDINPDLAQLLSSENLSQMLNQSNDKNAVFYPNAVSVVPKSVCQLLLKLSNAKLRLNSEFIDISKDSNSLWNLELNDCNEKFDIVIFAGGYELFNKVSYLNKIPVYPSHGQLTVINKAFDIDKSIMDKGYIIPNYKEDLQVIGATFRGNNDIVGDIRESDNEFNISQIKEMFSDNQDKQISVVDSRVATRCVTSDHLPLIGKLVDYDKFENDFFKPISKGYPKSKMPQVEYEQGLYLASGFGSKGMCSSMVAAKIITSEITKQRDIVSDKLLDALSPQRFWIRSFKKKRY